MLNTVIEEGFSYSSSCFLLSFFFTCLLSYFCSASFFTSYFLFFLSFYRETINCFRIKLENFKKAITVYCFFLKTLIEIEKITTSNTPKLLFVMNIIQNFFLSFPPFTEIYNNSNFHVYYKIFSLQMLLIRWNVLTSSCQ